MTEPIELKNYDSVAKLLHWSIVLLLAVQYAVAWTMPEIHRDMRAEGLISLHLSIGTVILLIMLLRLAWRLFHPIPLATEGFPVWQVRGAYIAHLSLYGLLIAMPALGWPTPMRGDGMSPFSESSGCPGWWRRTAPSAIWRATSTPCSPMPRWGSSGCI